MQARPDRMRLWTWAVRAFLAAVIVVAAIGGIVGSVWLIGLDAIAIVAVTAGRVLDANRQFWGPGPSAMLADPVARARWRQVNLWFLLSVVVMFIGAIIGFAAVISR